MKTITFDEHPVTMEEMTTDDLKNDAELIKNLLEYLYEIVSDFSKVGQVFVESTPKDTEPEIEEKKMIV